MLRFALKIKPDMVTIVPEKRQEITTEGGLNVSSKLKNKNSKLMNVINKMNDRGIAVSLFIDPEMEQIKAAGRSGVEYIEIHTGRYALSSYLRSRRFDAAKELKKIRRAVKLAKDIGLKINAGHGLDYQNVKGIAAIPGVEEFNIGFSIIARAVFVGMREATKEMKEAIG
jgi:pyridoxine 5-phosphate synthase